MVHFGDTVQVIPISELLQARMTVSYQVWDAESGELRCTGTTSHCYYDGSKKRPVSLKRALPELYSIFEALADKNK